MILKTASNTARAVKSVISRYCYYDPSVPYSCPGNTWEQMPTSSGRVATVASPSTSPSIGLMYRIIATSDTRVYVKLFDESGAEVGVANTTINGPALTTPSVNKVDVDTGGTIQIAFYKGLERLGFTESINYEKASPIAATQVVKVRDVDGYGPMVVGVAPLPENIQGLWWLTNQGASSALVSFGGPNFDGAGCSTGLLDPYGRTRVRVEGERSFSTAQRDYADLGLEAFDGVYDFYFNTNDTHSNPTFAHIAASNINGFPFTGSGDFFANFSMTFLPEGRPEYAGSKVWLRQTSFMGINAGEDYLLVQVVDGNRQKIEPAWSKFQAYLNSTETGWSPGWMWYPSNFPSPSVGAPAELEKGKRRFRMRLAIAIGLAICAFCSAMLCLCYFCHRCCGKKGKRGKRTVPGDGLVEEEGEMEETSVQPEQTPLIMVANAPVMVQNQVYPTLNPMVV